MVGCAAWIAFWYVGTTYSWGVLQAALVDRKLAPPSTLAFVGSLAVALLSVLSIINSRLLGNIGARRMGMMGVLLMGSSQILAGWSTRNVAGLFVTAGVMMGVGVSLCFMVVSIAPAQYFSTKRGTAVGLVYAGGGLGGAVISLAMEAGVRRFGPEWTFRGVGIIMLVTCLPAAWYLQERASLHRNVFLDWCVDMPTTVLANTRSLFRSADFLLLFITGAFATFPLFVPPFFLPLLSQSLKLSTSMGAVLVCLFNGASAAGRMLTGILADRWLGPINTLCVTLSITALSLLVMWPTSTSFAPLVVFVIVNGMSNGGFFSIMPTVVGNVLGSQRISVAFGMIVTGWIGGYLMGAPAAGYLLEAYGGTDKGAAAFRPAMFWAGGMAAGAAGLAVFLRLRKNTDLRVKM